MIQKQVKEGKEQTADIHLAEQGCGSGMMVLVGGFFIVHLLKLLLTTLLPSWHKQCDAGD